MANADIVRQAYAALQARDMAALVPLLDPDHVFEQSDELPWGGRYVGVAGFMAFLGRLNEHVESTPIIATIVDAGPRVAVVGRTTGTSRATGVSFDVPFVHVYMLRDGRIVHSLAMIDNAALLTALGRSAG